MVPAGPSWAVKGRRLPGRSHLPFLGRPLGRPWTLVGHAKTKLESYHSCSGFPPPPFPSVSSHFPHPLVTFRFRYLDPRPRYLPILALTLAQTIPLGSTQFVSGFPILLLVSLLLLSILLPPWHRSSTLLLPAVCRRLYLRDRSRNRTKHLQPPLAT
ncbi:hypothetical protein QBC45DRAFT_474333 [Copromyces sp. CBS 386.78]|nr:hypothetical protein QBC45DRAFT_474333 [Copromyces sp. CBS 386.78]